MGRHTCVRRPHEPRLLAVTMAIGLFVMCCRATDFIDKCPGSPKLRLDEGFRLMVSSGDSWYKVCTYGVSAEIADVLCREMGFSHFRGFGVEGNFPDYNFWESTDVKYFTRPHCTGRESCLDQCKEHAWTSVPLHGDTAASIHPCYRFPDKPFLCASDPEVTFVSELAGHQVKNVGQDRHFDDTYSKVKVTTTRYDLVKQKPLWIKDSGIEPDGPVLMDDKVGDLIASEQQYEFGQGGQNGGISIRLKQKMKESLISGFERKSQQYVDWSVQDIDYGEDVPNIVSEEADTLHWEELTLTSSSSMPEVGFKNTDKFKASTTQPLFSKERRDSSSRTTNEGILTETTSSEDSSSLSQPQKVAPTRKAREMILTTEDILSGTVAKHVTMNGLLSEVLRKAEDYLTDARVTSTESVRPEANVNRKPDAAALTWIEESAPDTISRTTYYANYLAYSAHGDISSSPLPVEETHDMKSDDTTEHSAPSSVHDVDDGVENKTLMASHTSSSALVFITTTASNNGRPFSEESRRDPNEVNEITLSPSPNGFVNDNNPTSARQTPDVGTSAALIAEDSTEDEILTPFRSEWSETIKNRRNTETTSGPVTRAEYKGTSGSVYERDIPNDVRSPDGGGATAFSETRVGETTDEMKRISTDAKTNEMYPVVSEQPEKGMSYTSSSFSPVTSSDTLTASNADVQKVNTFPSIRPAGQDNTLMNDGFSTGDANVENLSTERISLTYDTHSKQISSIDPSTSEGTERLVKADGENGRSDFTSVTAYSDSTYGRTEGPSGELQDENEIAAFKNGTEIRNTENGFTGVMDENETTLSVNNDRQSSTTIMEIINGVSEGRFTAAIKNEGRGTSEAGSEYFTSVTSGEATTAVPTVKPPWYAPLSTAVPPRDPPAATTVGEPVRLLASSFSLEPRTVFMSSTILTERTETGTTGNEFSTVSSEMTQGAEIPQNGQTPALSQTETTTATTDNKHTVPLVDNLRTSTNSTERSAVMNNNIPTTFVRSQDPTVVMNNNEAMTVVHTNETPGEEIDAASTTNPTPSRHDVIDLMATTEKDDGLAIVPPPFNGYIDWDDQPLYEDISDEELTNQWDLGNKDRGSMFKEWNTRREQVTEILKGVTLAFIEDKKDDKMAEADDDEGDRALAGKEFISTRSSGYESLWSYLPRACRQRVIIPVDDSEYIELPVLPTTNFDNVTCTWVLHVPAHVTLFVKLMLSIHFIGHISVYDEVALKTVAQIGPSEMEEDFLLLELNTTSLRLDYVPERRATYRHLNISIWIVSEGGNDVIIMTPTSTSMTDGVKIAIIVGVILVLLALAIIIGLFMKQGRPRRRIRDIEVIVNTSPADINREMGPPANKEVNNQTVGVKPANDVDIKCQPKDGLQDASSASSKTAKETSFTEQNGRRCYQNQLAKSVGGFQWTFVNPENAQRISKAKSRFSPFGHSKVGPLYDEVDKATHAPLTVSKVADRVGQLTVATGECSGKGPANMGIFNYSGPLGTIMSNSLETEQLDRHPTQDADSGLSSSTTTIRSLVDARSPSSADDETSMTSSANDSSGMSETPRSGSESSFEEVTGEGEGRAGKHRIITVRPCTAEDAYDFCRDMTANRKAYSAKARLENPTGRPCSGERRGVNSKPMPFKRHDSGVSQLSSASTESAALYSVENDRLRNDKRSGMQKPYEHFQAPPVYICPLSKQIMECPVIAPDGMVYDKKAILEWFRSNGTSPFTGQKIPDLTLRVDFVLLTKIQNWRLKNLSQGMMYGANRATAGGAARF